MPCLQAYDGELFHLYLESDTLGTVGHHHDIRQKFKVKIPMILLHICIGNGMLVPKRYETFPETLQANFYSPIIEGTF